METLVLETQVDWLSCSKAGDCKIKMDNIFDYSVVCWLMWMIQFKLLV